MSKRKTPKVWPGEPPGLWPAPEPMVRDERRTEAERIEVVREGFRIEHAISRKVGARLAAFVDRPWEPHQRWRGLLLVGPARSGRLWLVSHHLPESPHVMQGMTIRAIMPTDVSGDRVLRAMVERHDGYISDLRGHAMRARALRDLERCRVIVLDGADHLADLGHTQISRVLSRIKGIGEQQRVPMILVVNPRVLQKIRSDPDWEPRFEAVHLPQWRVDRDLLELLTAWENELPLQENSRLADRELALHLYALCDGSIGRLSDVLREATLAAIDNAGERITISLLDSLRLEPPPTFRNFLF